METKKRHFYGEKFRGGRVVDGMLLKCQRCSCVKQFVKGVPTYFLNDMVYLKSPECNPLNKLNPVNNP